MGKEKAAGNGRDSTPTPRVDGERTGSVRRSGGWLRDGEYNRPVAIQSPARLLGSSPRRRFLGQAVWIKQQAAVRAEANPVKARSSPPASSLPSFDLVAAPAAASLGFEAVAATALGGSRASANHRLVRRSPGNTKKGSYRAARQSPIRRRRQHLPALVQRAQGRASSRMRRRQSPRMSSRHSGDAAGGERQRRAASRRLLPMNILLPRVWVQAQVSADIDRKIASRPAPELSEGTTGHGDSGSKAGAGSSCAKSRAAEYL